MKNFDFKTDEEFFAAREEFYKTHPDAPIAEDIECLSLIMKKEYALQILAGTKKLEFRSYSKFYTSRVIDKRVADYVEAHFDDDEVLYFCEDIRQVKKIHFHDYNNSWFLDIEVDGNSAFCITKDDVEFLQETYDCHDFDADLAMFETAGIKERPWTFYFVCGKVIDTNLEVDQKVDSKVKSKSEKAKAKEKPGKEDVATLDDDNIIVELPELESPKKESDDSRILKMKVNKSVFNEISRDNGDFTKEITPKNQSIFFLTDEKGNIKEINGIPQFRRYDVLQISNGNNTYSCQIHNADIIFWDFDDNNLINYLELDEEERNDIDYTDCLIRYSLGKEIKE